MYKLIVNRNRVSDIHIHAYRNITLFLIIKRKKHLSNKTPPKSATLNPTRAVSTSIARKLRPIITRRKLKTASVPRSLLANEDKFPLRLCTVQ